ncbi:MAG TPA: DUF3566 domain-containing protein [Nocardioidaceae bacterium]|nr:DUF3566 domain-containing protein [Nocardioidaceae bacterium]
MTDRRRDESAAQHRPPPAGQSGHEQTQELSPADDRGGQDRRTRSQGAQTRRSGDDTPTISMTAASMAAAKDRFARDESGRAERGRDERGRDERGAVQPKSAADKQQTQGAPAQRPASRRARLRLVRIDPWSVMKTAFLLSIAFGIMCVVAVFVTWSVLGAANVFGSINASIEQIIEADFSIQDYIGLERVLPFTILIAVVDVVLLTAIATLGAFLYNLAASLLGGLEVTLAEDN